MKLLVMPSSIDEIKDTFNYCDAYLIGIKGLCVNSNLIVAIDDLDDICANVGKKELFINLNKNMSNCDLKFLKIVMNKLNDYNIKGVFYYDVGVKNIFDCGHYNYDLVWASEHASTNYNTINYWYSMGVNYCLVSNDITINEILDIRKNTECKLIVPIFGYQPMFNSKRHIIKNYLDFFKLKDNSFINYIEKEGKEYPIVDNDLGTEVYTNCIFNGLDEFNILKENGVDYILLNSFNIDRKKFLKCLKMIKKNDNNIIKIDDLFRNMNDGFLHKETIARVKKNDK